MGKFALTGYDLFCNSRVGKVGGGIAVYGIGCCRGGIEVIFEGVNCVGEG